LTLYTRLGTPVGFRILEDSCEVPSAAFTNSK